MVLKRIIFLAVFAFAALASPILDSEAAVIPKNKKLIFAHALWRHGKRNPGNLYPTSVLNESQLVPGPGDLNDAGIIEHYILGQRLRSRFIKKTKLVSSPYKSNEIYVRATYRNRTSASALSNMYAFYFDSGILKDNDLAFFPKFTPVPVNIYSQANDDLFTYTLCPKQNALLDLIVTKTPEFKAFCDKYEAFVDDLSNKTAKSISTRNPTYKSIGAVITVCDSILGEFENDLPRRPWVDAAYPVCDQIVDEYYSLVFGFAVAPFNGTNIRDETAKLFAGRLIGEMINRLSLKLLNYKNASQAAWIAPFKYQVYSAHDTSCINFLSVLGFDKIGVDNDQRPPTANAFTVELWVGDDGTDVVKVLYFKKDQLFPVDLSRRVTGCENTVEGCSLAQFIDRSQKYRVPNNLSEFCT